MFRGATRLSARSMRRPESKSYSFPLGAYAGASAAIREGRAYVGTFGNEVLAVDLQQRAIEWTYRHPTRSFPSTLRLPSPADRVIVGGRDKMVHALNRSTGKAVWTFTTRARVESSPLVTGRRVFVGSNDGLLYELDLVSGQEDLGVYRRARRFRLRPPRRRARWSSDPRTACCIVSGREMTSMRIAYITAGAGHMYCGSCLRDNTLAMALLPPATTSS